MPTVRKPEPPLLQTALQFRIVLAMCHRALESQTEESILDAGKVFLDLEPSMATARLRRLFDQYWMPNATQDEMTIVIDELGRLHGRATEEEKTPAEKRVDQARGVVEMWDGKSVRRLVETLLAEVKCDG